MAAGCAHATEAEYQQTTCDSEHQILKTPGGDTSFHQVSPQPSIQVQHQQQCRT